MFLHTLDPGFVPDDLELASVVRRLNDLTMDFFASRENQLGLAALDSPAHPAEPVAQLESVTTRARVRSLEIRADVRAIMAESGALIHIIAFFGVIRIHDVASVAKAQIASIVEVIAPVLTASTRAFDFFVARSDLVAASLISIVSTIIMQIANFAAIHAISIGALVIRKQVGARALTVSAKRHVIFV